MIAVWQRRSRRLPAALLSVLLAFAGLALAADLPRWAQAVKASAAGLD